MGGGGRGEGGGGRGGKKKLRSSASRKKVPTPIFVAPPLPDPIGVWVLLQESFMKEPIKTEHFGEPGP